ncbi:MAG TPA: GNAT family N-acetyltransferase, partial [Propionibacteriaceae bacterium]
MVAFPRHVVVAAAVDRRWVESWTANADPSVPLSPMFLGALEEQLRLEVDNVDAVLLAGPSTGEPDLALKPVDTVSAGVRRARWWRHDVHAWAVDGGLLLIGQGLGRRWEVSVEVDDGYRGK